MSPTTEITSSIATLGPLPIPRCLEVQLRAIPGVVDTGLFLEMADIVLVGNRNDFGLIAEKRREQVPADKLGQAFVIQAAGRPLQFIRVCYHSR